MITMSGLTLNLNLDTPDRINALFPKCRPRTSAPPSYLSATDINLNQISSTTSSPDNINTLMMDSTPDRSCDNNGGGGGGDDSHDSHDDESSVEESTGDEDEESPGSNLVLQLKNPTATTYKLRDSRIIEIAGGREVYCQSRSKSSRSKSGNHGGGKSGNMASRNKTRGPGDIWELRSKLHAQCVVEPKKQQPLQQDGTSSEVTETVFSNEVSSVKHQRQQNSLGADEGCVVFDDIGGDEWGRRPSRQRSGGPLSSGGSSPSPPLHHYPFHFSSNHPLFFKQQQDSQVPKHSGGESRGGGGGSEASLSSDSKHSTAGSANQKVLGSPLPIAQYEGSPRRYGNANKLTEPPVLPSLLSSPSVYLPKPGFPQRILDEDSSGCTPGVSSSHQAPATISTGSISPPPGQGPGFDYLYEFSETRKVLEEFFKPGDNVNNINNSGTNSHQFRDLEYELRRQNSLELDKKGGVEKRGGGGRGSSYVGLRLASDELCGDRSPRKPSQDSTSDNNKERDLLSGFSVSTEMLPQNSAASVTSASGLYHHHHHRHNSREPSSRSGGGTGSRAPYPGGTHQVPSRRSSPQSESEILSLGKSRNFTLSPETTDCESNCGDLDSEISSLVLVMDEVGGVGGSGGGGGGLTILPLHQGERPYPGMPVLEDGLSSGHASDTENNNPTVLLMKRQISEIEQEIVVQRSHHSKLEEEVNGITGAGTTSEQALSGCPSTCTTTTTPSPLNTGGGGSNKKDILDPGDIDLTSLDPLNGSCSGEGRDGVGGTLDDPPRDDPPRSPPPPAPTTHRSPPPPASTTHRSDVETSLKDIRVEAALKDIRLTLQRTKTLPIRPPPQLSPPLSSSSLIATASPGGMGSDEQESAPVWVPRKPGGSGPSADEDDADTDLETDRLLGQQRTNDEGYFDDKMDKDGSGKKKGRNKEGMPHEPSVLIEGVLFRARYLGSTQLVCEGQPTKSTRMMQAEEAVSRIKAPEGETQPSTEVDLFISTEKIMVLNTDLKEIMMDHALRTISYIADIGDLVVLMARRRFVSQEADEPPKISRTPKMICHVFESDEAQFIAQSIGQAFQVAYMEFLKANGIEDHSFVKEMDYQEVLNSQEIFGDELQMFAKKELQKEVVVPKAKGEILGVVIVESGWGSMLPTVVIANLAPAGAAARCGQLNIGDQIIAVNGVSLVGLPLSTCQTYIKNSKNQTVVKLTVVPCAPVVEVKIKRPDTKYQLGFSVQNGVICSLLRGGIAERGGVRVGHRIIEINNQSVVAVPHEKIVNLLATSVGEILMKTMPTSMFRLLTGQETPVFI